MLQNNDEKKYEQLIRDLKNLPKVNAPTNFESELTRKINSNEPLKIKESWLDKILSPKFIPSAALAVTTVVILLLLKGSLTDVEDPFQLIPRIREDYQHQNNISKIDDVDEKKDLTANEKMRGKILDSDAVELGGNNSSVMDKISVSTINYVPDENVILKGGLNFKILTFSKEERKKIEMLRERINKFNQ